MSTKPRSFLTPFLLATAILLASCSVKETDTLRLSALDLSGVRQGWGKAQADKSVTGKDMSIAGKKYEFGVGTHANSTIRLQINRKTVRFQAEAGVDDQALNTPGSVVFKISGDGKTLWESPAIKAGEPAVPVDLEIRRVKELELTVTDAGNGIDYDHANWAMARFTGRSARSPCGNRRLKKPSS
jgi:alpha-galactosidase